MATLLDYVYDFLVARGVAGGATGWPLYKGYFPDDGDNCVAVFETGGQPRDTLQGENERVTFQLRVRAGRLNYEAARARWQLIFNVLQDSCQITGSPTLLPGVTFIQAMHMGPATFNDKRERPNMTTNWRVLKTRTV